MATKRDINGFRTPDDVVRRYDLADIKLNSEDIEMIKSQIVCDDHLSITSVAPVQNKVITEALNNKVNKVEGKGLSTNDFTNSYKNILDNITINNIEKWNENVSTTLYSNVSGTVGDITFDTSITNNMKYLDIIYADSNDNFNTTRVYDPTSKKVCLQVGCCDTNTYTNRTQSYAISSTGMTAGTCHMFSIDSSGVVTSTINADVSSTDKILVYKVIGYGT